MQQIKNRLIFSATDLSHFLACGHLSLLNRRAATGEGPKPPKYDDPALEVLWRRGLDHERRQLDRFRTEGRSIVTIAEMGSDLPADERWRRLAAETANAMESGADVIYQGALFDGTWVGLADFLVRVDRPSDLGEWSYEVMDTKLAREAKGGALLQVLLYAELLRHVQGIAPEHVHISLGGPEPRISSFRVADHAAYFRFVRRRFLETMNAPPQLPAAAELVEHCRICAWSTTCDGDRRAVDHLSLVAGISARQRRALDAIAINTLESLASVSPDTKLDGVTRAGLDRIRAQALIQLEGRREKAPIHELITPIEPGHGLAALPAPSEGDLFFDIEGDRFALGHGLEYLFGLADRSGHYTASWALDRDSEKLIFERFIDFVVQRRAQYPDLHVYHYNHYEPTALKRLMGWYGTRERELDDLLRGRVFVDLYRVVQQGVRASVESYSIKKLERFYGYERDVDLRNASSALAHFEAWLELGGDRDDDLLRRIEGYNRDDCISTLRLHDWLETLRVEHENETGTTVPRPEPPASDQSDDATERDAVIDALVLQLTDGVPADPDARTPEQNARWLTAQLIEFHRREKKAFWWEYFHRCEGLSDDELVEDRSTIGRLEYVRAVGPVKRSIVYEYRFPPQEHAIRVGDSPHDPVTRKSAGTVVMVDDEAGVIHLKRGNTSEAPHPEALVPHDHIDEKPLRESLLRLAQVTVEAGLTDAHAYRSAVELLLRNAPRTGQPTGAALQYDGESAIDAAVRLVERLDHTVLPIQGPPGAGKTYTAARMIVRALTLGKRVGVTAQSHKVISNLLEEVCRAAMEAGFAVNGMQKADEDQWCGLSQIRRIDEYDELHDALARNNVQLIAGTAWLWSRDDMAGSVDLLVIDEAGQFSLANALAVAPAAQSMVLVGDPQQLEQPIQGTHPPGVYVSALEHLLGNDHTVSADRGLFLEHTWRLHPTICAFTSELFYDGRLQPRAGLERQQIVGGPIEGSGLRLVPVVHAGNQSESTEEVEAIALLVDAIVGGAEWINADGARGAIGLDDILVVAPYNAQVAALIERLPAGARVGTVDRFQGREAPIVIYSMATSTAEDAPRGMRFLYSPHRLNVATSRARCMAIVVASRTVYAGLQDTGTDAVGERVLPIRRTRAGVPQQCGWRADAACTP